MSNSQFYLERVAQCDREAAETDLENVRDRCIRARDAWQNMADRTLKGEDERAQRAAEKLAAPQD